MFAYHAPKIDPHNAKGHPALAPILHAGPWEFRPHRAGGTFISHVGAKARIEDFGEPIEAEPSLFLLPPRSPISPDLLAKPAAARNDVSRIVLACGHVVSILPAYLEPRRVLSGGRVGDPVTEYGLLARDVLAIATGGSFDLLDPNVVKLVQQAFAQTYRVTAGLLDWSGWISTTDLEPLVYAVMIGPKDEPASDPSALSQAVAGSTEHP